MPLYNYLCLDCQQTLQKTKVCESVDEVLENAELVLFETSHKIEPSPEELLEATTCPRCNSTNCRRFYHGNNITCYIRGNGYLYNDGTRRDMNLHHLTATDETGKSIDPYQDYRQPGEVDDLKARLQRGGQHNPQSKHFVLNKGEMETAVQKAASQ